jgi:hypothetical protein
MISVYDEETITKKAYDEACAITRSQDPFLRSGILRLIHDPTQVDTAQSIVALFNSHQVSSVSPVAIGPNGASLRTIGIPYMSNNIGLPISQPLIGGPSFNPDLSLFSQTQWAPPQQSISQPDSGFWSDPICRIEGDGFSPPPQPMDFVGFQTPIRGQGIGVAAFVPMTAGANHLAYIDIEQFESSSGTENAYDPGVAN